MTDPIDCDGCGTRILPIGTRCPLCGHEHDDTPDVTVTHDLNTDSTTTGDWSFTVW